MNDNSDLDLGTPPNTESVSNGETIPEQSFRFMDLPAEIRCAVLKEFLIMPSPIMIGARVAFQGFEIPAGQFPPFAKHEAIDEAMNEHLPSVSIRIKESEITRQAELLNIFLASKLIYQECAPLYFHHNCFSFHDMPHFESFVARIGSASRWQLARIRFSWQGGNAYTRTAKLLATCFGLRELTMIFSLWSFSYAKPPELRGLTSLLQTRGLTKLNIIYPDPNCYVHIKDHGDEPCPDLVKCKVALEERLRVLELPMDPKILKKQEAKDFPEKAKRTSFGTTNVMTRGVLIVPGARLRV